MVERWNTYEIQLSCFMMLLVLYEIGECFAVNVEGLALLEFRERIEDDPRGAFSNWNVNNTEPCLWFGVQCGEGKVQTLNLGGFSLQGTLAPELNKLRYLRSLVLSDNRLSGSIPKEISELKLLELLDLRHNNLTGSIPSEIGAMPSLKCLYLAGNNFGGKYPLDTDKVDQCVELQHDVKFSLDVDLAGDNLTLDKPKRSKLRRIHARALGESFSNTADNDAGRVIDEEPKPANLVAEPSKAPKPSQPNGPLIVLSSGMFPAEGNGTSPPPEPAIPSPMPPPSSENKDNHHPSSGKLKYLIILVVVPVTLIIIVIILCLVCRRNRKVVRPCDAALLHRLSKVFVTGVPKLNAAELETACEDFSNIVDTFPGCIVYKGILSSGVEIAVVSTSVRSAKQWSSRAEKEFTQKLAMLSRINHKNFVNLLGYCQEEHPFVRMMVFEYASNGTLYEHLHEEDSEHLDWHTRMRILMGTAYCLEHMHHDLDPPVILTYIQSDCVLLNDDYSAKVVDNSIWPDIAAKSEISDDDESRHSRRGSDPDAAMKENVYCLGVLLLETVSAKCTSEREGSLVEWFLSGNRTAEELIDPSLQYYKEKDLEIIREVASDCIKDDPKKRPSMREVTSRLREVINISPELAASRISPLWWAELEILSETG